MNIFKQLFVSLYSPKDIARFRLQKTGKTILYVLLLTVITILPVFFHTASFFNKSLSEAENIVKNRLPDFSIEEGTLTSDAGEPVTINTAGLTFVLDSTGELLPEDLEENSVALLKNEMAINSQGQLEVIPYSTFGIDNLSKDQLLDFLSAIQSVKGLIGFLFFLFIYISQIVGRLLQITILALIGLILSRAMAKGLAYGQLWKMSAYSITLPAVFFMIMNIFLANVPFSFWINWGVMIIMLYLSLKEVREEEKPA